MGESLGFIMKQRQRSCELCGGAAALYCEADAAFLCFRCDRRVHSANFLVARHLRRLTCPACLSSGDDPALVLTGPGAGSDPIRPLCRLCCPDPSMSASSCVSTADSDSLRPRSAAVRVFERWGEAMGVRRCADVAARAMGAACGGGMAAALPMRAAMAAAMWFAVRVCCDRGTCEGMLMRRLERCSGVPRRLIVFYEARIARAVGRWRRRRQAVASAEEGWGECS